MLAKISMLCLSVLLLTDIHANALTFTTNSSLNNTYLGSSGVTGSFDISPYVDTSNYTIDSASIMFTFYGDTSAVANKYATSYNVNTSQQRSGSGLNIEDRTFTRYTYNNYYSSIESVTLLTETGTARSKTSSFSSSISNPVFAYDAYSAYADGINYYCNNYYSYNYTRNYGYGGLFSISDTLNSAELASLRDGEFAFSLTGFGTSWLTGATLTASISHNPVPEPSTLLLFGAGLAGAAYLRSRKKL